MNTCYSDSHSISRAFKTNLIFEVLVEILQSSRVTDVRDVNNAFESDCVPTDRLGHDFQIGAHSALNLCHKHREEIQWDPSQDSSIGSISAWYRGGPGFIAIILDLRCLHELGFIIFTSVLHCVINVNY